MKTVTREGIPSLHKKKNKFLKLYHIHICSLHQCICLYIIKWTLSVGLHRKTIGHNDHANFEFGLYCNGNKMKNNIRFYALLATAFRPVILFFPFPRKTLYDTFYRFVDLCRCVPAPFLLVLLSPPHFFSK